MNTYPHTNYHCNNGIGEVLETFKELLSKYDELNDKINELSEIIPNIEDVAKIVVDREIEKVNQNILLMREELTEVFNEIYFNIERVESLTKNEIENIAKSLDKKISILNEDIKNNYDLLSNRIDLLNLKVNNNFFKLNDRIDKIEIKGISAFNQIKGYITPITEYIDDVYNALRFNSLTAEEFEERNNTALMLDSYNYSAINFDLNNKNIIMGVD